MNGLYDLLISFFSSLWLMVQDLDSRRMAFNFFCVWQSSRAVRACKASVFAGFRLDAEEQRLQADDVDRV